MSVEDVQPPAHPVDGEIAVSPATPSFDNFTFIGAAKEAQIGAISVGPPLALLHCRCCCCLRPRSRPKQGSFVPMQATSGTATTVSARRAVEGLLWC